MMKKRTKILIISVVVVVALAAGVAALYFWQSSKQDTSENKEPEVVELDAAATVKELDNTDGGAVVAAAEKYRGHTQEILRKLYYSSKPADWKQQEVNEAHYILEYSYKMGDYPQVQTIASMIEVASQAGVDVNKNEFAITQDIRNQYVQEANAQSGTVQE